jgi:hypothetical protein
MILIVLKRLLIAALFFVDEGFEVIVLILELVAIFYIFTTQPFKYEIYTNIVVIIRLLIFVFYGLIVLGNLYYSVGRTTVNFQLVKNFLYVRDGIFLVIVMFIFLFIFYEFYVKCSNLNYQIRVVREENEFKIKIVEK